MTDQDLLQEIKKAGLLNEAVSEKIKKDALLSGKSVETLVTIGRLVDDVKIAEIKSKLLGIPYKKVDPKNIGQELLDLLPEETARSYEVIPLEKKESLLIVGMLHPDNPNAQEALRFIARREHLTLGVYLISWSDFKDALRKYSPYRSELERAVQQLDIKSGESSQKVVHLEEGGEGEEAPIIKMVADTFKEALASRASDIHIEPMEHYLRIRFRIDGDLREVASLPSELSQPLISRVKVISSLKIDESRIPQGGRFRTRVLDRDIDFRVATFPTPLGENVAIRVLDPRSGLKRLESLGFRYRNLEILTAGLGKPFGMILASGPTGSGKTTTLYAILQTINKENVNIVSLEDPVEYFVEGINQSQVRPEIGYDFASGLRQILRQDPDVVMVGEIRDSETAGLAVQAALTGHIVLSSLHTNNSAGVIPRLIDMKVEPFLLPVSLNIMMSQRLVGELCQNCKTSDDPVPDVLEIIRRAMASLSKEVRDKYPEPYKVYHARGCAQCKGKGIVGRISLHEVFEMTPEVEEIIVSGPTLQKLTEEAKRQGMITLRQDGVLNALEGKVLIEEVVRGTQEI